MTSLMQCDAALFICSHHLGLFLQSTYDTIDSIKEVLLAYSLLVVACSDEGSLITNIGDICTRESRSLTSQEVDIYCIVYLDWFQMNLEDGLTLVQARQINVDFTVETTGTEQGTIQHINTVGSCKDDDTTVGTEAVHLCKEGIQGILTFIVTAHGRVLAAGTTHGINLIDEDNAWRLFLSLSEEVANTGCTDTHKHFNEVGTAHREEWYTCFTSYSLCQERLTCSRRTHEECSLRNLTTQVGIFLWVFEELHDFLHFLFGTFLSGHVLEGNT